MCRLCTVSLDIIELELEEEDESMHISCGQIDTIPAFNNLCELYLTNCTNLTYLPKIQSLELLHIQACASLLYIPSFPNLHHLHITSSRIRQIPPMRRLMTLLVSTSPQLHRIHRQPNLISLTCISTPRLQFNRVDKYPNLMELELVNVPLYTIPDYFPATLRSLTLKRMYYIHQIPPYLSLNTLCLEECHLVQTIPVIDTLRYLDVMQDKNTLYPFTIPENLNINIVRLVGVFIYSIPQIATLTTLDIHRCRELEIDFKFPELDIVLISGCPKIRHIPALDLNRIEVLHIVDMPHLEIFNRFFQSLSMNNKSADENKRKLIYLQEKLRWRYHNRKMLKYIKFCKTDEFNEWFWSPDEYGGRWCMNRLINGKPGFEFDSIREYTDLASSLKSPSQ